MRTYTLRTLNVEAREMTIDFVAHGEEGPASRWAINANEGDQLVVFMKVKGKQLIKPADWYFIEGDHTAQPVMRMMLERLPADAKGQDMVEVGDV